MAFPNKTLVMVTKFTNVMVPFPRTHIRKFSKKSVQQSNYTCRIIMQICSLQYKINLCVLQEDEIYHAKIDLISSSSRSGVNLVWMNQLFKI